ncbi:phenylalanine--tRNA ligase subunit beta [Paenibacillus senegalensis]|uniref:phenylalanine--tRNA ligase subunit beta n=1 Tax=Paenibacillus senegalensis TaxID=1465766 RepID=UPI000288383A|nr:phenylalanine--tRNA ligase subunit beta [Paenibacillus senegalensis]
MKVSYQWLSDYIDLSGLSATELAEKLTRSGIEVDVVEQRNKGVHQVVVGLVKTREKHPDADKLSVCTVDVGGESDLQIVCGAKNVDAGQKVPVAVVGAVLPDNFKIKRAKLRGVESQGMICSAKELGMNDRLLPKEIQEGILVLPEDTPIGASALAVLGLDDEVLELDLTPNRSDCLSMLGAAYEIGAITGREVNLPNDREGLSESSLSAEEKVKVKIDAPDQCYHYAARYVENVEIKASPLWIQNRLMAAGIRPINIIVDVTNYVMLETGQPLHAFDYDKLDGGNIVVRMARQGETIVTLDDVERKLDSSMLLITDGTKPVAVAGVMGAANSEVTAATSRIVLESAYFAGPSVRKASRQLGLRSEASLRFEKEVNPEMVLAALNRAASLICQYAGGKAAAQVSQQIIRKTEPVKIDLSIEKLNEFLGTSLSENEVQSLLARLQFPIQSAAGGTLTVTVPTRRGDITRAVDLYEEAARLHGYDHIPTTLMEGVTTPGALNRTQQIRRAMRTQLSQSGLQEAITYSLVHPRQQAEFPGEYANAKPVKLAMPMSEERSVLRTSIIPNLLETAEYNLNRGSERISLFEIGKVFLTEEDTVTEQPEEKWLLSILISGEVSPLQWSEKPRKADFFDLKGIIEKLLRYLGINGSSYEAAQPVGYHPGRTAEIWMRSVEKSVKLGTLGQLHPDLQRHKGLEETYIAELDVEALVELSEFTIQYRSLPRYPSMARDLALVVDASVEVGRMEQLAWETAGDLLESIAVFDIYTGERIGEGKKSVALSFVYRHPERTLTDDQVTEINNKVIAALEQTFAAELRK